MLQLKETFIGQDKKTVNYKYEYSSDIGKYFKKIPFYVTYDLDLTSVPNNILNIPLLANILPISWFAGFDIKVNELDKKFYEQALKIKTQFSKYYPIIKSKESNLIVTQLIENPSCTSGKNAMLFSGGLDAYTTLLRHYGETPDLITIKGADIAIDDDEQWNRVVDYNNSTDIIANNRKHYIESNLREFITFEVDKLLIGLGWWGKVQHGIALTCLTAPISYINKYNFLYIGSTRSNKMPFSPWGSMPEIDNLMQFSTTNIIHDGYELTRFDKTRAILKLGRKHGVKTPLRVCYLNTKIQLNCNECEKCCRTIFAIMINNENPNLYGFNTDKSVYDKIKTHLSNGFNTPGVKFYWNEMIKQLNINSFYFLDDSAIESEELIEIIKLNEWAQKQNINVISKTDIMKKKLINKYPKLHKVFFKLKNKLS